MHLEGSDYLKLNDLILLIRQKRELFEEDLK